ncbi:uncharacterized protein [Drosophila virilis]|uniref:Uncharacterized protein n=1 Tax=Drosophila virilis TaxID=7244 RepID=B4LQC8_DROVI|nr:uncharacterized protein LOC6628800 [Drosophila virilis]EDW63378.1 uncharacterized protein Dvir_GJ13460 [Drosophila virilis]
MAAAAAIPELFISHATIQLRQPSSVAPPRVYEWRTQVTGQTQQAQEAPVERIRQSGSTAATATAKATPTYTPPRIQGNEAKRKNLPQTLCNFFEAERHDSAWNRVTK